jgi:hypothetical protein
MPFFHYPPTCVEMARATITDESGTQEASPREALNQSAALRLQWYFMLCHHSSITCSVILILCSVILIFLFCLSHSPLPAKLISILISGKANV